MIIKKAVIPAAGFGTRFLPTTKAMPKEMINIVDRPAIQYVVEEAVDSGIEEILIIISRNKEMIINHFDETPELDQVLSNKDDKSLLKISKDLASKVKIYYVRQGDAKGLGHAIYCAKGFANNEPFAVLLPDDIIDSDVPVIKQLIESYERHEGTILGVQPVPKADLSKYGIVAGEKIENDDMLVSGMIEKPKIEEAPSDYAILGRYILNPSIFEMIEKTPPGKGGEIQLTDAILLQKDVENVYASVFSGVRYDTGDKLGYLKATVNFAMKHPTLSDPFKRYLEKVDLD
ncbi:MAG: UTP--glucose-1-phosphate uridylyltransferase GalU [Clostridiales bacterium]|nr:UTP--glucose-1-phosphate uridylyltransferase GalU [Clostridiales bacterium]